MPTVSAETDLPNINHDCPRHRDCTQTQPHPESPQTETAITFLFSDIERSTRLWEAHPNWMQAALAQHDAHLRQNIEARDGHIFKTAGDSFCAAFACPDAALAAALTAQKALHRQDWGLPGGDALRVRVALHCGPAEIRNGDYFGVALSRTARLLGAAHGGQTLVSETLAACLAVCLPDGAGLRSLGRHRLKDLTQPQEIFQVTAPGLPADFPPLRSLESFTHNLPGQFTSFIGREREMADAHTALQRSRLVTLCGPGGSGKTRLALQVAADALDFYPDGVWLVELAPIADPALVLPQVAAVLGIREESERRLRQTLVDTLRPKSLLLILDNCEHLVDASARLAESLLQACPALTILATSREALEIGGERTLPLSSLSMPPPTVPGLPLLPLETLLECEAIRLFVDRAISALPTFRFSAGNSAAVASVCSRLDGIPLALELAAARVKVLSPEQIADRLDDRFRLLSGGNRTALPRQQTLRALLDWSYDLLAPSEQTLLRRLSVFAGGWSLDAAESICAGATLDDWEVLDLLSRLVAKSLVVVEPPFEGQVRYHLQENLRQYVAEKLAETDEGAALAEQHLAWFLAYAEEALPLLSGGEQVAWLHRLERDHDNLRLALRHCQETDPEAGLRLARALSVFWRIRGYFSEGIRWFETFLASTTEISEAVRAAGYNAFGTLTWSYGDFPAARQAYNNALAIKRRSGDQRGIAGILNNLAMVTADQGDLIMARQWYQESLAIYRTLDLCVQLPAVLQNLSSLDIALGNNITARHLAEEALALYREYGDVGGQAMAQENLGNSYGKLGDFGKAFAYLHESLRLFQKLEDKAAVTGALHTLAFVCVIAGEDAGALYLFGTVKILRDSLGLSQPPSEVADCQLYTTLLRDRLGAECLKNHWPQEEILSWQEAIERATELTDAYLMREKQII